MDTAEQDAKQRWIAKHIYAAQFIADIYADIKAALESRGFRAGPPGPNYHHMPDGLYHHTATAAPAHMISHAANGFVKQIRIEFRTIYDVTYEPPRGDTLYITTATYAAEAAAAIGAETRPAAILAAIESFFAADGFPAYPRGISLFAGAGGDAIGMAAAGIRVVGFVEKDAAAAATHAYNMPHSRLIGADIGAIPTADFAAYRGRIAVLFAGFPCQSFSYAGKKKADDPRGAMYREFVRAAAAIRPTWVVGENVRGILRNGAADAVIAAFAAIGYTMTTTIVNARNFGIPQDRCRVIFIGTPHRARVTAPLRGPAPPQSLRDILTFSLHGAIPIEPRHTYLTAIPDEKFIHGPAAEAEAAAPPNLIKCAAVNTISYRTRAGPTFGCVVDIDMPSRTILCTYGRMPRLFAPMAAGGRRYMRPFTAHECQLIQGFPADFEFKGPPAAVMTQIGNAAPPAIVAAVCTRLLAMPRPRYARTTNEPLLLELIAATEPDMTYDAATRMITYNGATTSVYACAHPALAGAEKYTWGICHREETAEYEAWRRAA